MTLIDLEGRNDRRRALPHAVAEFLVFCVTAAAAAAADVGVIADEPSTSSATEEFGRTRDQHTSLSRYVTSVWNHLRTSRSFADVDVQFQTTEYRDEMTMDSLIEGSRRAVDLCCTSVVLVIDFNFSYSYY